MKRDVLPDIYSSPYPRPSSRSTHGKHTHWVSAACLTLFLIYGSACTKVDVTVHAPAGGKTLTGLNCKLQRELRNKPQETDYWCWAASAHTVIEYLKNERIDQCAIVDAVERPRLEAMPWPPVGTPPGTRPPAPNCCMAKGAFSVPEPGSNIDIAQQICWDNVWPEYVFYAEEFRMRFNAYEYDVDYFGPQGLSWDEIVTEICEDRPMISAVYYKGTSDSPGGSHTVVIGGYSELEDGSRWVQVYDPGFNTLEDDYYIWSYDVYLGDPGVFVHVRDYKNISLP